MLWTLIRSIMHKAGGTPGIAVDDELQAKGLESFERGDFAAACRYLNAAHAACPGDADIAYHLALAEARSGRPERAEELLESLRMRRDDAEVNNALGNVQRLRGQLDSATASYRRALDVDSGHLAALANLGLALRDQGAPGRALPVLERALELAPDHVDALFNKALALVDLGENPDAENLVEQVLQLDPGFAQAHLQRGFMRLKRGDFAAGWPEYAWRARIPDTEYWREYDYQQWQGEALAGRSLLVQAEQGLGDQIMFASCLPEVLARAQHTILECDPRLARLFARSFPSAAVYCYREKGNPDWLREPVPDFRVRCGDLPRMLRTHDADFPRHGGYLVADPARAADWRGRLAALGPGLKVGISWRGGTPGTGQAARSLALEELLPILALEGANFVSLQYGAVDDEIAELRKVHGIALNAWPQVIADIDEMAALVASLDLVITVCTTAAHLCGALGKTAWVMVPAVAEWRYLASGPRMPWYPALRLFRQSRLHAWSDVVTAMHAELRQQTSLAGAASLGNFQ